jgi:3-oxoacyl-[acyl-carrier protein] reductase
MGKLDGRVAIVTGSGRGIGRAIALKLAGEGAQVVVNDLDEKSAAGTVSAITTAGGEAIACPGDVSAPDAGQRLVDAALARWGDLHIVVNNAGYTWDAVIQKMSDEQFADVLEVHLAAPFRLLRAALAPMRAARERELAEGREITRKVVNVSSTSGIYGNPGQVNYAAAKAGVIGMTRTLAKEWGRYRITVNAVAFGLVHTRLTRALSGDAGAVQIGERRIRLGVRPERLERVADTVPLGRGGSVEEAAGAVYLFCIPESDYVSGQVLVCDGGGR